MNDTTYKMQVKQFEIYQSKSIDEKFQMITEMMAFGVNQMRNVISQRYPKKSNLELQIEFFKLYYRDDFNAERIKILVDKITEKLV